MLKSGLKVVESISKATKSKGVADILKAGSDTAKVITKVTKKKKKSGKC